MFVVSSIGAALFFLVQGKADKDSAIVAEIVRNIQQVVGEDYQVDISNTDLDLSDLGRIAISTRDISITRNTDRLVVATLENVSASADLLPMAFGQATFRKLRIEGAVIDAGALSPAGAVPFPSHLDVPLNGLGQVLARIEGSLGSQGFEEVEIQNSEIRGKWGGRREGSPLSIASLVISHESENALDLKGTLGTALSDLSLAARYVSRDAETGTLNVSIDGVDMREWFEDPASSDGVFGLDSKAGLSGDIVFRGEGSAKTALDPKIALALGPGTLRIGPDQRTTIANAVFNLSIYLDRNQIELEKSTFAAEGFQAELVGGLKPVDEATGYGAALLYDFIIEKAVFQPVLQNEPVVPAAFQIAGQFDPDKDEISAAKIILTTQDGAITGAASINLDGETPSARGSLKTDGISVLALKQYWPFFLAAKARDWIHDHIIDGRVVAGAAEFDVPHGILFRLKDGAKFLPEQLRTTLQVRDFSFRPFGELPPIENGEGEIKLEGMSIQANLARGTATDKTGKDVVITSANFVMPDFGADEKSGKASLEMDGDLQTIARISDREPLRVMQRMKVEPDQFRGEGHADIAANFPLGGKVSYEDVDWNVLIETRSGSSTKPLSGRKITGADLLIDANPRGASVTGTAKIDGVEARLRLTEPIGKSGEVDRKRVITASLDDEDRKRLGFNLDPVLTGKIGIEIEQSPKGEIHTLDFTEARISLPWIGWQKGKGIVSDGRFKLSQSGGTYTLNDFVLRGASFETKGRMVLTKDGLQSANFTNLRLNDDDDVQLKVERTKDAYNINATGLSFDVRSILNTLIHSGGFAKAQGGRSVNLVANFDTVKGFNNRIMRNALLLYESRNGRLSKLDMSANGSEGRAYKVQAQLNGNETLFSMQTNDAGNALAFTDIYTRMENGELVANLLQSEAGPFLGPVRITNFNVVNEPKLSRLASNVKAQVVTERGQQRRNFLEESEDRIVRFQLADAKIERGTGYLNVSDGIVRSASMGLTVEGKVYDENDRVNLTGTFMPANAINLAVSAIPILGQLLSNGRDQALIGISYQLLGSRKDPALEVNPLSIVAPGVFNEVFEFRQ